MRARLALFAAAFVIGTASASQQSMQDDAVAKSHAAIGNMLPAIGFVDTEGRKVDLADFQGRPLFVTLV